MMHHVWLSLTVAGTATLISLAPGIAVAWILERTRLPGRGALHSVVLIPLALPPVVTGYLLLWLFSPKRPLGEALAALGLPVAFHWLGAVIAAATVGFPFLVSSTSLAMKSIDPRLETTSQSLGRSRWQTFWRVTLPLAWPGILSGALLSFARGLGEFGATIVLAGNVAGKTDTVPLAIYGLLQFPGTENQIAALVGVSVVLALGCLLGSRLLDRRHRQRLELEA